MVMVMVIVVIVVIIGAAGGFGFGGQKRRILAVFAVKVGVHGHGGRACRGYILRRLKRGRGGREGEKKIIRKSNERERKASYRDMVRGKEGLGLIR
jgi:hypothetical protein